MSTLDGAPQNVKSASERICRVPMPGESIRLCRANHRLETPEKHSLSVLKGILRMPQRLGELQTLESSSEFGWRHSLSSGQGIEECECFSTVLGVLWKLESIYKHGGAKKKSVHNFQR